MGDHERQPASRTQPESEILDPRHFYAAYVFDQANEREKDVETLIDEAHGLGYPVRFWWLSEAMDLQGSPDRLIVCIHHPSGSEDAGMDLYQSLEHEGIYWDDLEAAVLEEYRYFGTPVSALADLHLPSGETLFPKVTPMQERLPRPNETLLQITQDDVREEAQERLGRKLSSEEFATVLSYFKKALEYLDWRPHLDEAIRWCEDSGLIKPGEEELQTED